MSNKMKTYLGKRLKELREERGYTQKQVAGKLGLNSVTYLHYEKEQREPPLALLADMGTGKSMMTIAITGTLEAERGVKKMLVVCPKSIVGVWEEEFR